MTLAILDGLIQYLKDFWGWLLDILKQLANGFLETVNFGCPDLQLGFGGFDTFLAYSNLLIDVNFLFKSLTFLVAFWLIVIPIKLVVKLFIPTLG